MITTTKRNQYKKNKTLITSKPLKERCQARHTKQNKKCLGRHLLITLELSLQ